MLATVDLWSRFNHLENKLTCGRKRKAEYSREEEHQLTAGCLHQVEEHIIKLSKKGITPSQIGVTLRDSHGVTQIR